MSSIDGSSRRPWQQHRSATDNAGNQTGVRFSTYRIRFRFRISRLPCLLGRVFRLEAGAYQGREDRDRGSRGFDTLTCHFLQFQLLALAVSLLARGMIELHCKARLVFAVGLAALRQSCLITAVLAAVTLTPITRATDIKDDDASWTPTYSLADLVNWQGGRAFPKAGLDNGRQSWQAMDWLIGWFR